MPIEVDDEELQIPAAKGPMTRLAIVATLAVVVVIAAFFRQSISSGSQPLFYVQAPGDVGSLKYSADGGLLIATEPADGIALFDTATGRIVQKLPCSRAGQAWLSRDDKLLLTTSESYAPQPLTQCVLWDVRSGRVLRRWTGPVLDVLPDFSLMLTADDLKIRNPAVGLISSPRKPLVRTVRVVDVASGHVLGQVANVAGSLGTYFSRDGRYLYVASTLGQPARVLRLPDLKPILPLPQLWSLCVSADGTSIFGVAGDSNLYAWDLKSRKCRTIPTGLSRAMWLYLPTDGTVLIVMGEGGAGTRRRQVVQVRSSDGSRLERSFVDWPLSRSADGRFVAVEGQYDGNSYDSYDIANVETGGRIASISTAQDPLGQPLYHDGPFDHIAIAPDAKHYAISNDAGLIRFYAPDQSGRSAPTGRISTDEGSVVYSSGDGSAASVNPAAITQDGPPGDYYVLPKQEIIRGETYQLTQVATSHDGRTLATIWNGQTSTVYLGKEVQETDGQQRLELRNWRSGALVRSLTLDQLSASHDQLANPVFSPDGRMIAAGDGSGQILLWDTATGCKIGQLSGARAPDPDSPWLDAAPILAISPNNQLLAAQRNDGSIYLYSLRSMLPVAQIGQVGVEETYGGYSFVPLRAIGFDPTGRLIYGVRPDANQNQEALQWTVPRSY